LDRSATTEIVLLPGLHGTGHLFADFARECPSAFVPRVIEYPCDRFLDYRELLPFVRDRLPQDSDFVILGESFSGPLAVMLAAGRPRRLRAVVLVATFVVRIAAPHLVLQTAAKESWEEIVRFVGESGRGEH
jgi:pimeloyl-ACP methyl ester carboxylesterase